MNIKSLLGRLFEYKQVPELLNTPDKIAEIFGVEYRTVTGQNVSTQRAMQMTTVFACVRVLAESMGMLPCRLYKDSGKRTKELAVDHKVYELLSVAPNDYMTAQEFWELAMTCLCLRGNFYAYKVYVFGQVAELLPINPSSVVPRLKDDWTVEYDVTFADGVKTLTQDEIWHVRLFTFDGLIGLNPIAYARHAIALGLSTEEHGSRLFTNGAVTSGVLETEQTLNDAAFGRLKEQFQDRHVGVQNAYKPMILEMGLQWKPISLNAEDSQFLETRQYQRDEICAIFRVPGHLVASMEKMTLNNIEHMGMSFVNYALVPYMTRFESRIRVGLLNAKDRKTHYAKFNAGALLRGDLKGRYESYGKGIQWGILSPNDCRELEDLNPRDGGDIYLTPMNMTTKPEGKEDEN